MKRERSSAYEENNDGDVNKYVTHPYTLPMEIMLLIFYNFINEYALDIQSILYWSSTSKYLWSLFIDKQYFKDIKKFFPKMMARNIIMNNKYLGDGQFLRNAIALESYEGIRSNSEKIIKHIKIFMKNKFNIEEFPRHFSIDNTNFISLLSYNVPDSGQYLLDDYDRKMLIALYRILLRSRWELFFHTDDKLPDGDYHYYPFDTLNKGEGSNTYIVVRPISVYNKK